ncbi:unnamed protein product [Linum trigynum]|uniref:Uncharacterized protein n=1 Tax=Linum trigynum TaxID=586398 RepID=A0AAV2FU19_9ROSI
MKPKDNPIRAIGQRSIMSSLVFPSSSNRRNEISALDPDAAGEQKKNGLVNSSKLSLSDFLNKKLHKTAVRSRSLKGKSQPFLSPLGRRTDSSVSGGSKDDMEERNSLAEVDDELVFHLFKKPAVGEKGNAAADSSCGFGTITKPTDSSSLPGLGSSHSDCPSRTGLQACEQIKHTAAAVRKPPLVLGGDQQERNRAAEDRFNNKKKQEKVYNHYANGSGWWDCDMEGVDSEEVGFGEIWEGVGTTTFGGIEWH